MAINIQKQIVYWSEGAKEDLDTASILLEKGKNKEALFFAHLALEKALKALVAKNTSDVPPYSHDLTFLAKKAGLTLSADQSHLFNMVNKFATAGRYPDPEKHGPSKQKAKEIVDEISEVMKWLIRKLSS
ncbi:MAG TPA: HEPN domain-containing protein [bacterium]|nr:HEPN domain-containing protein [bacterium]